MSDYRDSAKTAELKQQIAQLQNELAAEERKPSTLPPGTKCLRSDFDAMDPMVRTDWVLRGGTVVDDPVR